MVATMPVLLERERSGVGPGIGAVMAAQHQLNVVIVVQVCRQAMLPPAAHEEQCLHQHRLVRP